MGLLLISALRIELRHARPIGCPPHQIGQARQQGQRSQHGKGDPNGSHRPQRTVGTQIAHQQAQQPCYHGSPGGQDRLQDTAQRGPGGLCLRLVPPQLLEVAGCVEQRVVRGSPYHQDEQDSLGLACDRQYPPLGQPPIGQKSHRQRKDAGQQHSQGQDHGSVDDQQDHQHQTEGNQQQKPIDSAESLRQVAGETSWTGHMELQASQVLTRDVLSDGGDRLRDVRCRVDTDENPGC